ncbi:raffinose/stachyose/melibiose transport system permease protein [Paenibacillus sophorae]|uniref:Raffinose/stachyose/melibiose transport system permease protein n=2 Tax=Paenibacillus sophorae TaxID=1333845 RepID=A0A1H8L3E3_9BACL|nr:carbohydrate ABC transporter permease [Paenibacillus sophorae]SEN99611.1 raffinose/stachyose/melibiose transport system permease protein [Paenibacillus sophorae]
MVQRLRTKRPLSAHMHRFVLLLLLVINIYPLLWMILNSLKTERELSTNPFGVAREPVWSNYIEAWKVAKLGPYLVNSIIVTLSAVVLTLLVGALAAFFLSRFEFKSKGFLLVYFTFGMLIPIHATLVPLFIEMRSLNLMDNRLTLLLPYTAFNLPITIFILAGFMNAFPKEVEEAGIMDGCSVMGIFGRLILPMLTPALATAFIINFLNNWNEFSFALVLINDGALKTLPLGLANFAGQYNRSYTLQMAGLTIVLVPTLLFYLSVQKYLTAGMTAGAVKG